MIGEIREYTLTGANNQLYTVPLAKEVAPGLLVYRLPDGMHPTSPNRWRIGHESSGLAVADALTREDAVKGAEALGELADWTQSADSLRASVDRNDVFTKLRFIFSAAPMNCDVSRNGTYTDADIEEAAREAKASGFNAADILVAMAETVPWMGLDTNEFNEAHDRIVRRAEAD
ncbi:hypothetical protein [Streptomyces lydicus]|uniref:hypothetical protein n=1 Tax=Streptomyces lydicus TaxID=47763 RepID=UPI0037BA3414